MGSDDAGVPGRSCTVDLDGPVHYVDFGGNAAGPAVVLVHGLAASHLNWDLLAPLLTPHARVYALDLPGFGRSEPEKRRASVPANVLALDRFLAEVVGEPTVLVGNSMGGMISLFEAARSTRKVSGLVLLDPVVPGPRGALDPTVVLIFALYSIPLVGERILWLGRQRQTPLSRVREMLRLCGVNPDDLPAAVVDRWVGLLEERRDVVGMDRAFLAAARSLVWILLRPHRYREAMRSIQVPVLMLHGDRDRLVPVEAAREISEHHPGWRYVELPGVGHMPQLQCADDVAEQLLAWMGETAGMRSPA